jgi:hypothetical protein
VLVNHIFEEKNIEESIEEIDEESDMFNRIFVIMTDGSEYIIRTWNIHDDDELVYIDYTLFYEKNESDVIVEL